MSDNTHIGIHIIQSFPGSNPNRDRNGQPKTVFVGGKVRHRISSQALKKPIKNIFGSTATRSLLRVAAAHAAMGRPEIVSLDEIKSIEESGIADADAKKLERAALTFGVLSKIIGENNVAKQRDKALGRDNKAADEEDEEDQFADVSDDGIIFYRSDSSIYVSPESVSIVSAALLDIDEADLFTAVDATVNKKLSSAVKKPTGKASNAQKIVSEAMGRFDKVMTTARALFGQMSTAHAGLNTDAVAKVSDAFSTHEAFTETDFYVAVDDLDSKGTAMMGYSDLVSSVHYRYITVDVDGLRALIGADTENALVSLVKSAIRTVPTGKLNTYANDNSPSLVYVTIGDLSRNLSNAFVEAIVGDDLIGDSARKMLTTGANVIEKTGFEGEVVAYSEDGLAAAALAEAGVEDTSLRVVLDAVKRAA